VGEPLLANLFPYSGLAFEAVSAPASTSSVTSEPWARTASRLSVPCCVLDSHRGTCTAKEQAVSIGKQAF